MAPRIANLGNPDINGYGYSDAAFAELVSRHADPFDVCVVVTGVPIEGNFFTRSMGDGLIISTFYQADDLLQASGRSPEAYAAMAVCQELVSMEFQRVTQRPWSDLFHQDPRGCLFDFAGIKSQKLAKLRSSTICDDCLGKLDRANVNDQVKSFARALLTKIRRPSFAHALELSVTAPGLSFAYGGLVVGAAVNLFSSVLMNPDPLTAIQRYATLGSIAAVLLFPLSVYSWLIFKELKQRLS